MIAGALMLEVASTADVSASVSLICASFLGSITIGSHRMVERAAVEFLLNTSLAFAARFGLFEQPFLIVISFFVIVVVVVGVDDFVVDDKIGVLLLLLLALYEEQ